ncbi:PAS domain-containing protein [Aggregatimonas sangjinii]|uniref:PAS domain-containing protein n=1 Tax=Aggregatimonas sangjinii TaxID=2583587 RepID=A0A5B7SV17_9FLAO|nr:PAS domain-containing protein [Aggregatimonas sangjinii]QCX02052.1 PAS domain-containing protein [Aggregatimonas sangjinii]
MSELLHYDNAVKEFYDTRSIKSLPLNSWDCFSENFDVVLRSSEDIVILNKLAIEHKWNTPLSLEEELLQKQHVVIVTDADLKIVHATHNMVDMNGYTTKEVIGNSPKMFQGKETSTETSQLIADAIKTKQPFEAVILNYRKNGSTYKCWIKGQPIFNADKDVVHFIAYEKEVA